MTRNERKKAYLKVLDLMERGNTISRSLLSVTDVRQWHFSESDDIVYSLHGDNKIAWDLWVSDRSSTHEDDKNFIALCVALCDEPI